MSEGEHRPGRTARGYQTPADLRLMQALSSLSWRADWPAPHTHPGDLDWWSRDAAGPEPALSERARLWFAGEADASDLVAWAWFNLPGDVDLQIHPDHRNRHLVGAMVDWAAARASSAQHDGLPVEALQAFATDAQPTVVEALLSLGFERADGHSLAHLTRNLDDWSDRAGQAPRLPDGYRLRPLEGDADVASRVACGRAAFPRSRNTVEKYEAARGSTLYRPALDWIIEGPRGEVVAFALGWLDPVTLGLGLEPVGVQPDLQRRGFGRAVCIAAIEAGRSLGAREGLICAETDNPAAVRLYQSLGYRVTTVTHPYRRQLRS